MCKRFNPEIPKHNDRGAQGRCHLKAPRTDNTNTPIRGQHIITSPKTPIIFLSNDVTIRSRALGSIDTFFLQLHVFKYNKSLFQLQNVTNDILKVLLFSFFAGLVEKHILC